MWSWSRRVSPGLLVECAFDTGFAQLLSKHGEPLVQPRLHSTQRTVQKISDLLERQAVVLLQDNRCALFFRELGHGFADRAAELVPRDEILNRLGGGCFASQLDDVHPF